MDLVSAFGNDEWRMATRAYIFVDAPFPDRHTMPSFNSELHVYVRIQIPQAQAQSRRWRQMPASKIKLSNWGNVKQNII